MDKKKARKAPKRAFCLFLALALFGGLMFQSILAPNTVRAEAKTQALILQGTIDTSTWNFVFATPTEYNGAGDSKYNTVSARFQRLAALIDTTNTTYIDYSVVTPWIYRNGFDETLNSSSGIIDAVNNKLSSGADEVTMDLSSYDFDDKIEDLPHPLRWAADSDEAKYMYMADAGDKETKDINSVKDTLCQGLITAVNFVYPNRASEMNTATGNKYYYFINNLIEPMYYSITAAKNNGGTATATLGGREYTVTVNGDYVVFKNSSGATSGNLCYTMEKPGGSRLDRATDEVDPSNIYSYKYLNWKDLYTDAYLNVTAAGELKITVANITASPTSEFESILVDLFASMAKGIKTSVGLWDIDDLIYNTGTRGSNFYTRGLFPTSWEPYVWGMFFVAELVALVLVGIAIARAVIYKAMSSFNPVIRVSLMDQVKDLIIVGIFIGLLPLFIQALASLSSSIASIFPAITEKSFDDQVAIVSSSSGTIVGIIIQLLYLAITISFNVFYILRSFTLAVLIILAPIFVSFLAMGDNKKKLFSGYLNELMATMFIQPIQAGICCLTMLFPADYARPVVTLVALYAIMPISQVIRGLFFGNAGAGMLGTAKQGISSFRANSRAFRSGARNLGLGVAGVGGSIAHSIDRKTQRERQKRMDEERAEDRAERQADREERRRERQEYYARRDETRQQRRGVDPATAREGFPSAPPSKADTIRAGVESHRPIIFDKDGKLTYGDKEGGQPDVATSKMEKFEGREIERATFPDKPGMTYYFDKDGNLLFAEKDTPKESPAADIAQTAHRNDAEIIKNRPLDENGDPVPPRELGRSNFHLSENSTRRMGVDTDQIVSDGKTPEGRVLYFSPSGDHDDIKTWDELTPEEKQAALNGDIDAYPSDARNLGYMVPRGGPFNYDNMTDIERDLVDQGKFPPVYNEMTTEELNRGEEQIAKGMEEMEQTQRGENPEYNAAERATWAPVDEGVYWGDGAFDDEKLSDTLDFVPSQIESDRIAGENITSKELQDGLGIKSVSKTKKGIEYKTEDTGFRGYSENMPIVETPAAGAFSGTQANALSYADMAKVFERGTPEEKQALQTMGFEHVEAIKKGGAYTGEFRVQTNSNFKDTMGFEIQPAGKSGSYNVVTTRDNVQVAPEGVRVAVSPMGYEREITAADGTVQTAITGRGLQLQDALNRGGASHGDLQDIPVSTSAPVQSEIPGEPGGYGFYYQPKDLYDFTGAAQVENLDDGKTAITYDTGVFTTKSSSGAVVPQRDSDGAILYNPNSVMRASDRIEMTQITQMYTSGKDSDRAMLQQMGVEKVELLESGETRVVLNEHARENMGGHYSRSESGQVMVTVANQDASHVQIIPQVESAQGQKTLSEYNRQNPKAKASVPTQQMGRPQTTHVKLNGKAYTPGKNDPLGSSGGTKPFSET